MRVEGDSSHDISSIMLALTILALVGFVGFEVMGAVAEEGITPVEQTEHYDRSEAWCDAEGGDLYVANDATNADHNGLHCDTGDETYHMWAVADLNYTHDGAALAEKCGATNVPLFVGCRGWGVVGAALVLAVIVVVVGLLTRYQRGD